MRLDILAYTSLLGAVAQAVAVPGPIAARQVLPTTCEDVHLFLARGAGDPYPGTQGPLVEVVCQGLESCDHEDILYVGTFDKVCDSVTTGVVNATRQITEYADKCPDSKLVLLKSKPDTRSSSRNEK
ncbi:unnamed protein product [Parascedosporium putredinis]|uniref:Uncharacterized protein n=1 Tax=Parascedosporium putredinis TaxID=1442378 RepID=A0A9P1H7J2_9PEZI|nr:unnamed protein product [Parascedosporium putredinis]CAI8001459.1 unnamed protein product [Parascedosporium putredinis]